MKRRRLLVGLFAFVGGVACIAALYYLASSAPKFDRKAWLAGNNQAASSEAPRLRIADGLIESGILLGKPREFVGEMLGQETQTGYFRKEYDAVYWLGPERGLMSIDSEWLVLKYDALNRVSVARIVRD